MHWFSDNQHPVLGFSNNSGILRFWISILSIHSEAVHYLRDARVGGVQEVAEEWVSIVRADTWGSEGKEVIVEQAFSKQLVEEAGGVAQGASKPGVLDGNIHNVRLGNSQLGWAKRRVANFNLNVTICTWCWGNFSRRRCMRRLIEAGTVDKDPQWCVPFPVKASCWLYTCAAEREAYKWISLEWHYLMVGTVQSAESVGCTLTWEWQSSPEWLPVVPCWPVITGK